MQAERGKETMEGTMEGMTEIGQELAQVDNQTIEPYQRVHDLINEYNRAGR